MLTACKTYTTVNRSLLKHSIFCTYCANSKLNHKLLFSHSKKNKKIKKTAPCSNKQKAKTGGPRRALGSSWRSVWAGEGNIVGTPVMFKKQPTPVKNCPNQPPSWKTFMVRVLKLAPRVQPFNIATRYSTAVARTNQKKKDSTALQMG